MWPGLGWQVPYHASPGWVMLPVTGRVRLASYDLLAEYYGLGAASFTETALSHGVVEVVVTDMAPAATNRFLRLRVSRP